MNGQILLFDLICQIFISAMQHKSRAICLQTIPFRETSIIARFFTEFHGVQSFIASGVRSAKSGMSPGLFQPLSPVEIVHYLDERKDLNRLVDIKPEGIIHSIPLNPAKIAISIFVAEYLCRILRDSQENAAFFSYILNWIRSLDESSNGFESGHIAFVWHSFSYLGIVPEDWKEILESGAGLETIQGLDTFFRSENHFDPLKVGSVTRQVLLQSLVRYASEQMGGFGEIKSLLVLKSVFA